VKGAKMNDVRYRKRKAVLCFIATYAVIIFILSIQQIFFPERSGFLALLQVFAPYLFLPFVLCLLFIRNIRVGMLLLASLLVFIARFPPNIHPISPSFSSTHLITVMNWNVHIRTEQEQITAIRPVLLARTADIIALEECYWEWIIKDGAVTEAYPYQTVSAGNAVSGMVLLSRYPIVDDNVPRVHGGIPGWPPVITAHIDVGLLHTLTIVTAHPQAPSLFYDTAKRDLQIAQTRAQIDRALHNNEQLLVLGDFNLTTREPQYAELTQHLQDAYSVVGDINGLTWGPGVLLNLPVLPRLLRIDYLLTSPNITPRRLSEDCTARGSDHCILRGIVDVGLPNKRVERKATWLRRYAKPTMPLPETYEH